MGIHWVDMIGRRIGRWLVLSKAPSNPLRASKQYYWICRCDCGTERAVAGMNLRRGDSVSCGCHAREIQSKKMLRHGKSKSAEYQAWTHAKLRCYHRTDPRFPGYGGRGLRMCKEWRDSFEAFLRDMGHKPPKTSLDRINNDGHYEPSNCRWATHAQQVGNKRFGTFVCPKCSHLFSPYPSTHKLPILQRTN